MYKSNYKVYCDMDGVIADFYGYMRQRSQTYRLTRKFEDKEIPIGAFAELNTMPDADVLMNFLKKHFGSNLFILTAIPSRAIDPNIRRDKKQWVKKHFNITEDKVYTVARHQKRYFANGPKTILIDDLNQNIDEWKDAGGTGILFKNALQCIDELKEILGE